MSAAFMGRLGPASYAASTRSGVPTDWNELRRPNRRWARMRSCFTSTHALECGDVLDLHLANAGRGIEHKRHEQPTSEPNRVESLLAARIRWIGRPEPGVRRDDERVVVPMLERRREPSDLNRECS